MTKQNTISLARAVETTALPVFVKFITAFSSRKIIPTETIRMDF